MIDVAIDPLLGSLSAVYLSWLLWVWRRLRLREAAQNAFLGCSVCGLAPDETDLDIYYRYGFTHEGGTRYAEPGSEIYEARKAAHDHG